MPLQPLATYRADLLEPVQNPGRAHAEAINLAPAAYAKGTALGELTATPGTFAPYKAGNVDGTGVAKGLLVYTCVATADPNGGVANIALGAQDFGHSSKTAEMYYTGVFALEDITGLDAAGVANLAGHVFRGALAAGGPGSGVGKIVF